MICGKDNKRFMTRREAREQVFGLLFEIEFKSDEDIRDIFEISSENREIVSDEYINRIFFGVNEKKQELDEIINKNSHSWRSDRISKVSRTILRMGIYEMLYTNDIPLRVSLNEAVELCKKFDDEKAVPFVNGVLNSAKNLLPENTDKKE